MLPASSRYFFTALLLVTLGPSLASAQVVISELMYDHPGSESSGDHDWIEVFNAGPSSVDLGAYRFFEGGSNHTLNVSQGSATLPVGGYAVIANKVDVFKVDQSSYTGALFDSSFDLNSSGESIGIRASDLSNVDGPFTYAPQETATDNGSSLQRTSVSSQAFTASSPTPGTGILTASSSGSDSNSTGDTSTTTSQTNTTQQTQTTTTTTTTSSPVSSYVTPPEIQIFADGGDDRTVIVGADTEFWGRAYNRDKEVLDRVRFMWNFGDGSTAEGITVLHHFDYPGRYAVVLNIAEHRSAASDVIVVEAEPAQLSFTSNADGSVSIGNDSGRDLDLSRWIVRAFGREFILPDHSIILEDATMHIMQKTLGFPAGAQTELAYPNGVMALRAGEDTSKAAPPVTTAPAAPPAVISAPPVSARVAPPNVPPVLPEQNVEEQVSEEATSSQIAASAAVVDGSWGWWLGAVGLAFAGSGVVFAARRFAKREWNIVEETGDAV